MQALVALSLLSCLLAGADAGQSSRVSHVHSLLLMLQYSSSLSHVHSLLLMLQYSSSLSHVHSLLLMLQYSSSVFLIHSLLLMLQYSSSFFSGINLIFFHYSVTPFWETSRRGDTILDDTQIHRCTMPGPGFVPEPFPWVASDLTTKPLPLLIV